MKKILIAGAILASVFSCAANAYPVFMLPCSNGESIGIQYHDDYSINIKYKYDTLTIPAESSNQVMGVYRGMASDGSNGSLIIYADGSRIQGSFYLANYHKSFQCDKVKGQATPKGGSEIDNVDKGKSKQQIEREHRETADDVEDMIGN